MHSGLACPLSHHSRTHARVTDVHVEAAPVRARRAPDEEVGALSTQQANNPIAVFGSIKIPGLLARAGAEVEGPGGRGAQARA
eukprot:4522381-Alexandrium_andersonii.AAC.1